MNPPANIQPVARRLCELLPGITTIALIGSRATGTATPDSDWDILVLVDGGVEESERKKIKEQLRGEFPELKLDILFASERWVTSNLQNDPYRRYWLEEGVGLWGKWPLECQYPALRKGATDSHLNLILSEMKLADVSELRVAEQFRFYARALKKILMIDHALDDDYRSLWPDLARVMGSELWERYRPTNGTRRVTRKNVERARRLARRKLREVQARVEALLHPSYQARETE
ncbi:MAG: nucleotidyltransferase domain-containing protein [Chloroflexi bacterium]|nr:nucleotidyltransferase domain-containing protein [Chloroflexota bacterium]MBI3761049.1 nucleotidyltransferase domain-containing protein [Chloroflexota bacterium]